MFSSLENPSKAIGFLRGLCGLCETGFCDVQSSAAKNKISSVSFSPSFPLSLSLLFLSCSSFLSPFFLSAFFRLSFFLNIYSLCARFASNISKKRNGDIGTRNARYIDRWTTIDFENSPFCH
ncbi:hypothetical protein P5V15_011424 [Pogonomyrmex californicus]